MRHLSAERLAALADEHPTPEETAHLAVCGACAQGRDAHQRLVAGAALERDRGAAPLSDWGVISARLRAEGIIRTPDDTVTPTDAPVPVLSFARGASAVEATSSAVEATPIVRHRRIMPAWAMRAAAGLALVAGGALAGRTSATMGSVMNGSGDAGTAVDSGTAAGIMNVSNLPTASLFKSTDEAQRALVAAERTYQAAMQYLAAHDTTMSVRGGDDPTAVYRARLAALDEAVAATRNALSTAPYDPVINRYYLSSVSAREATLRQLDEALPVSEQLTRF
jgi:hypothetical protein